MKRCLHIIILAIACYFIPQPASAQIARVDSFLQLLEVHPEQDSGRVLLLRSLAYAYYTIDIDKTELYSEEILDISRQIDYPRG